MGFSDFLFGESPELKFKQSPQQQDMWNTMFPTFQNFMGGNFPQMYDLPSPVGPTTDWYNNIAPEVRQSLWEPAMEGGRQMMEVMGSKGQTGSPGSPMSGSGSAGMGRLFADYSQGIGQQAWNMMQPGMMADYGAQLGRNIQGYQTSMMPFQTAANMLPGTYANPVVQPGSPGLMQGMMQLASPFAMGAGMGMMGGMNPFAGMFGGGQFGSGGFASLGGGTNIGGYMGAPTTYDPRWGAVS
jgi:hypothetical protein